MVHIFSDIQKTFSFQPKASLYELKQKFSIACMQFTAMKLVMLY